MLFVKDTEQTITSKDGNSKYTAAKLSILGNQTIIFKQNDMYTWLEKTWPDKTSNQFDKDLRNAAWWFLKRTGVQILCSDKTRSITFEEIIELYNDENQTEFVTECYNLAIKLNPQLEDGNDKIVDGNQEGTENADGELASKEKTDFLDLSDPMTS